MLTKPSRWPIGSDGWPLVPGVLSAFAPPL